jgi:hypothetical protein
VECPLIAKWNRDIHLPFIKNNIVELKAKLGKPQLSDSKFFTVKRPTKQEVYNSKVAISIFVAFRHCQTS